jgi:hypothetical protein
MRCGVVRLPRGLAYVPLPSAPKKRSPMESAAARSTDAGAGAHMARSLGSFAYERERQTGNDEGRKKNRQEPLSGASVGDDLALRGLEGLSSARVSAIADLHSVMSSLDRDLDRIVHLDRPDALTVDHDIVSSSTDLRSDCLVRQL